MSGLCAGTASLFLNPAWLTSARSLSTLNFICKCLDFGNLIFWNCVICLWLPSRAQGPFLLVQFLSVLMLLGEIPSPESVPRNWKTRLRHFYFDCRRWAFPEHYPRHPIRIRRKKRVQLRSFRRQRLAYHLVNRCNRRQSNHSPTLDGRRVPTRSSRRHRRWQGRNNKAQHRHWV